MSGFLGRRLIRAVLTVWAVATLVFLLMHALPGDVVLVLLDTVGAGSPAADKMRQFLGLDRPSMCSILTGWEISSAETWATPC